MRQRSRELARLRDAADEAAKRVKEACDAVGDDPVEFPELDEPEFRPDGWRWLLALVQQGPKAAVVEISGRRSPAATVTG